MEKFFESYQHTIEAVSAVATLLAVLVSLYIARCSAKSKITAYLTIMSYTQADGIKRDNPSFLTVNITNTGLTPIRIPFAFFCWKVPFISVSWLIRPLDSCNSSIKPKIYPFKIEAKHSELFILCDWKDQSNEISNFAKNICAYQLYFMMAKVCTEDGTLINASISKDLRKELKKIIRENNRCKKNCL